MFTTLTDDNYTSTTNKVGAFVTLLVFFVIVIAAPVIYFMA